MISFQKNDRRKKKCLSITRERKNFFYGLLHFLRGIEVTAMDHIARIVVLIGAVLLSINWVKFIKKNKEEKSK